MKCLAPKSGGISKWFNKEGKLEYTLQNCLKDDDTCFNLEDTRYPKHKGCGKLETLVEDLSYFPFGDLSSLTLNATDVPIKKDECKKISEAANKKWKKIFGYDDEGIKRMEARELGIGPFWSILEWQLGNNAMKIRFKTLCTCSEDGCNGGNKMEAKFYMLVITAFIFSTIFSS